MHPSNRRFLWIVASAGLAIAAGAAGFAAARTVALGSREAEEAASPFGSMETWVGEWEGAGRIRLPGMGPDPMHYGAALSCGWGVGKRFLECRTTATASMAPDSPGVVVHEGRSILLHDASLNGLVEIGWGNEGKVSIGRYAAAAGPDGKPSATIWTWESTEAYGPTEKKDTFRGTMEMPTPDTLRFAMERKGEDGAWESFLEESYTRGRGKP